MYISGFDPQGPAHYHQLYRTEAAHQAAVCGVDYAVGKRCKAGDHLAWWSVTASGGTAAAEPVQTRYEFLRWDDIVRAHWPRGRWQLLRATVFASWHMWRNGVLWQSMKTSWPMFVACALPGAVMLLLLLLTLVLGAGALALWQAGQPWLAALAVTVGLPALVGLGWVAERRSHMAWLMRSMACLVRQGRSQVPELEARLDVFAQHLADASQTRTWDEILVVGHSSGAMLAMIVTARAQRLLRQRASPSGQALPRLSLLTLGHCSPLLSEQPEADGFRAELRVLKTSPNLDWVDMGAPPDGCCFPLVDPTDAALRPGQPTTGPAEPDAPVRSGHPKLLNPRFAQLFTPATYHAVRSDKFRCHFQYLMATEITGAYDYFAITAGPSRLAERYAALPSVAGFRKFQTLGGPGAP
jgi:hypothetical protein